MQKQKMEIYIFVKNFGKCFAVLIFKNMKTISLQVSEKKEENL